MLAGAEEPLQGGAEMMAAHALMTGLVDYAGLFPPASLDMMGAVRRYREYLTGEERWALGRFVVPAARLGEFSAAFNEVCCGEREPVWGLSVLGSGDAAADAAAVAGLARGAVSIDSVELKAGSVVDAERLLTGLPSELLAYVEFEPGRATEMLPVLARFGARAKIRMGGVTAEAFPSVEVVADFLAACSRARMAFKATAGLHHAVRGAYKLTYEPGSARATMHGFTNVFLAAVLAWRDEGARAVRDTLAVEDGSVFVFGEDDVRWLGLSAGIDEIEVVRREFAVSYGSCSFTEPLEEVKTLGWV
ncbi:MAG: hypothetical protein WA634_17655 [Silvibacterium sp.]